jgi:hypothetical protein
MNLFHILHPEVKTPHERFPNIYILLILLHAAAHLRQASAHFLQCSMCACFSHSTAQAVHISAQRRHILSALIFQPYAPRQHFNVLLFKAGTSAMVTFHCTCRTGVNTTLVLLMTHFVWLLIVKSFSPYKGGLLVACKKYTIREKNYMIHTFPA